MKTNCMRLWCALALLFVGTGGGIAVAQSPQPQPGSQLPNLRPLAFVNVSLDGVAKPIGSSPTGIQFTPGFLIPRAGVSKTLEFKTKDGRSSVRFSHSLPSGVSANAFTWQQTSVAAPNAVGRLNYTGCQNCPASITISVKAEDPSGVVSGTVKLNLTASTRKPEVNSIKRSGGTEREPRYEIRFAAGTFNLQDSEAVATYAGNLKYRLLPESGGSISSESIFVVIPRLKASRAVQVFLRNPYGTSGTTNVELPIQAVENGPGQFNCVNCSTVFGEAKIHDEYSVKHTNPGALEASGTDEITITPLRSGNTPCDQPDFIYHTALVKWIEDNGFSGNSAEQGTVSVSAQPPVDQLLRSPQNKVRIAWKLKPFKVDRYYQVMFGVIDVVGVCQNRVVQ